MHFSVLAVFITFAVLTAAEEARPTAVDFYNPNKGGGSQLNRSGGAGEPLNVIVSGLSSPQVLTPSGFLNYVRAIGFSKECLGLHQGDKQQANLGDGHGWVDEREVLREQFKIPILGTCLESLIGGNHLRTYRQNGPDANSGALFLAVSQEEDLSEHHTIVPDGYNIGRDKLVQAAIGRKSFFGVKYETTARNITGLLKPGAEGVNHGIAQDGIVTLLTVTIKK